MLMGIINMRLQMNKLDNKGWIKLHRKISDNPLWLSEKFTRGQAWIDLILLANYADSYFWKRGIKTEVKRGQVAISEVGYADRWGWSRNKVRKFLSELEAEHQIKQQKSNVTLIVTIINYDEYQKKEQQTEHQIEQQIEHQTEQQKDTSKEEKEYKEDKNKNIGSPFPFRKKVKDLGVEDCYLNDWMKARSKKRASNTETAFNLLVSQINQSGFSANECIKFSAERSYSGFKADWIKNERHEERINSSRGGFNKKSGTSGNSEGAVRGTIEDLKS